MNDESKASEKIFCTLDEIKRLLQQSIAIQLYKEGATQDEIAKNLKIGKAIVNSMVRGIKKVKG